jgi:hypothetical protein
LQGAAPAASKQPLVWSALSGRRKSAKEEDEMAAQPDNGLMLELEVTISYLVDFNHETGGEVLVT